jgi:adenylate cyclase
MRLLPNISYGTERYPDKVARRLRVLNFTTWGSSGLSASFALADVFDPALQRLAVINTVDAFLFAAIPLLHRFGELAGALGYLVVSYSMIFVICSMLGTDSGMQIQYLAIAASAVLVVGSERVALIATFGGIGVALFIILELSVPHDTGLLSKSTMLGNFLACVVGTSVILLAIVFYAVRETARAETIAEREYNRSEALLTNILPAVIAKRLKASTHIIADRYDEASILFADMAGFIARASDVAPLGIVQLLNEVFTAFDQLVEKHGLEKIKTTGDGYVVVSGVPLERLDHAEALARFAIEMLTVAASLQDTEGRNVPLRIGIASGPMVAGVVGTRKFFYDVWGDTVNIASRMESTGMPGRIQVSKTTYERVKGAFLLEARGLVDVKGKGPMDTWFLLGPKTSEKTLAGGATLL